MVSTRRSDSDLATGLPQQFTLCLGPQSSSHVASLAHVLRDLGARVDIDPDGYLVAMRPNEPGVE